MSTLRCLSSATPGKAFVEACDLVVFNLRKDPSEPCLWIDTIKLGGFNQGVGDGGGLAAGL